MRSSLKSYSILPMQDYCFHIHTPRCGHADVNMPDEVIAKLFCDAGFKTIAFTDHNPWISLLERFPNHGMRWDEKKGYLDSIHKLAQQYSGKMRILTGFEMEYLPDHKAEMDELRNDAEILIIGQHFTLGSDGDVISMHKKGFVPTDYETDRYADLVVGSMTDGYAKIVAHPDLYMFKRPEFTKHDEEVARRIIETAIQYDIPLEINLCLPCKDRFFQPCEITYPRKQFWEIASEYKDLRTLFGLDFHGHFDPRLQDEQIERTTDLLGRNTISKLHICTVDEIVNKL